MSLDAARSGPLGLQAAYFLEDGPALSLEEARLRFSQGDRVSRGITDVLSFGIGAAPVWVHLTIVNPADAGAEQTFVLGTSWLDQVDVFMSHAGQPVEHWRTGDMVPERGGIVPAMGFVIPMQFSPGISDLFLRVASVDPLVLPVEIIPADRIPARRAALQYVYGALYGFMIALIVYNAILYAGLRKAGYLYYSLYIFSFIMVNASYTGHAYAWFWNDAQTIQKYGNLALMVLYSCAGLMFACRFLSLRAKARRLYQAVQGFGLLGAGAMALCVVLDAHMAAAFVAFGFVTLFTAVMVGLGVFSVRRGQVAGRYFLVAALVSMAGALSTSLAVWGWIPFTDITYHAVEVGILVEAMLLALALARQLRFQEVARQQAEHLALFDPLTGLYNRRAFIDLANGAWSIAQRRSRPLALMLVDLDHFKQVNDRYGHAEGDKVLVKVGDMLSQVCRAGDTPFRWGGEEFAVLLPDTTTDQAVVLAERLRSRIAAAQIVLDGQLVTVTVSIGVAERQGLADLDALFNVADERLYDAKDGGRNRIISQSPAMQTVSALI